MKKTLSFLLICSFFAIKAQEFAPGFDRFSSKKIAYIILKDGTKLEGDIDDIDRKKGNIEEITLKVNGKKKSYEASALKSMFLPASGLSALQQKWESTTNLSQDFDASKLKEGYALFENTEVMLKSKKVTLMMQLVNPGFDNKIKVYFDPFAQEAASVGFGPMKIGGGDKSYFVKKGDAPAEKYKKKDYEDTYATLYADCPSQVTKMKSDHAWPNFERHVFEHAKCK